MIPESRASHLMLVEMGAGTEKSMAARISWVISHAQVHLQFSKGLHAGVTVATLKALDHAVRELVKLEPHS